MSYNSVQIAQHPHPTPHSVANALQLLSGLNGMVGYGLVVQGVRV